MGRSIASRVPGGSIADGVLAQNFELRGANASVEQHCFRAAALLDLVQRRVEGVWVRSYERLG